MSITTEAYVARPPGLALEKVTYPAPGPHEVLVDVVAASICHSDVRAAAGKFMLPPPLIIGHEGSGYVRSVGAEVTYVKPGDAVVLAFASCLGCRRCTKGQNPYCDKLWSLNFDGKRDDGSAVATLEEDGTPVNGFFFGQSSMARIALVREESCVKVEGLSKEALRWSATLGCGIQTGAGAVMNVMKPPPGSRIAIFGGGAVGLAALLMAQLTGPAGVILVDISQAKLDMIPKAILGLTTTLYNSSGKSNEEIAADLRKLTRDEHGVDYAVDCVGSGDIIKTAHLALDRLGTLVTIGSGDATNVAGFTLAQHLAKGITYRGTHQGDSVPRDMIPILLKMWKDGQFPFDKLLTEFKFEEIEEALDEMKKGHVIKPLLVV